MLPPRNDLRRHAGDPLERARVLVVFADVLLDRFNEVAYGAKGAAGRGSPLASSRSRYGKALSHFRLTPELSWWGKLSQIIRGGKDIKTWRLLRISTSPFTIPTLAEVTRSVMRQMSTVIDVYLSHYFDLIRHSVPLDKIAKRVRGTQVLHLDKQIVKVGGKIGVPQGGPFSPLASNTYLNEVDWAFDAIRCKTAQIWAATRLR
jgi:hypothetical protein